MDLSAQDRRAMGKAREELEQAERDFEWAQEPYIDACAYAILSARARYDALVADVCADLVSRRADDVERIRRHGLPWMRPNATHARTLGGDPTG